MWKCNYCGFQNSDILHFCVNCNKANTEIPIRLTTKDGKTHIIYVNGDSENITPENDWLKEEDESE